MPPWIAAKIEHRKSLSSRADRLLGGLVRALCDASRKRTSVNHILLVQVLQGRKHLVHAQSGGRLVEEIMLAEQIAEVAALGAA